MAFHSKNDEMEIENIKKIRGKIVEIKIKIKTNENINYSCVEVQEVWPIPLQVIFWPLTMMTCMLFLENASKLTYGVGFVNIFPY